MTRQTIRGSPIATKTGAVGSLFLSILIPWTLTGCGAGIVGAIYGISSLSHQGKTVVGDVPPVITSARVSPIGSPDRILLEFQIVNEDAGKLETRVEAQKLTKTPDGKLEPQGPPVAATPTPNSEPLETLEPRKSLRFIWDARHDLGGASALAQFIVTPIEDGVAGEPFKTEAFQAGNTPARIEGLSLSLGTDQVVASFNLIDAESNLVTLEGAEMSLDGGPWIPLSGPLWDELLKTFASAPPPRGLPLSLVFKLKNFEASELKEASEPGYVGELCLRISLRDFTTEALSQADACLTLDNNEPPIAEILPVSNADLQSGVVPIRYRLFDRELNPATLKIEIDLGRWGRLPACQRISSRAFREFESFEHA